MFRSVPSLLLATLLCTGACGGDSQAQDDSDDKAPAGRSYDHPNARMSPQEKRDVMAICTGVVACERQGVRKSQVCNSIVDTDTESRWGELMVESFAGVDFGRVGNRVARLLVREEMKWASTDCRRVIKRHSTQYQ